MTVATVLALGASCSKKQAPEPAPAPKSAEAPAEPSAGATAANPHASPHATAGAQPASAQQENAVELEWTVPQGWEEAPTNSKMRKATYKTPGVGGSEGGELAVFYFGPQQGGDVKANIDRWVAQFKDVPEGGVTQDQQEVNGLVQHVVTVKSGTYSGSMMMGGGQEKPDQGMLGAVVESPSGKYFFKLTGPSKAVDDQRDEFFALLKSMKTKS